MNQVNELSLWLRGLAEDPEVFPHQLDRVNRRLLLVRLAHERVRQAAFLDQRVLAGDEAGAWVPLVAAIEATPRSAAPAGIILHCGHCGSTLVSRLLGELPGALRLSQAAYGKLPAGASRAIVKHTSLTANLGVELLHCPKPPALLCLAVPLTDYLSAMLRDPGLREGLRLAAGEWIQDIAAMLGDDCPRLAKLDDGEIAALNWTAARLAITLVQETPGARVLTWNFDDFLADPRARLGELAHHFGLAADEKALGTALASPWLNRYAKDPRQPFSAAQRRRELAIAARDFAPEIRHGITFGSHLRNALNAANKLKPT